jgi:hypothetical protein
VIAVRFLIGNVRRADRGGGSGLVDDRRWLALKFFDDGRERLSGKLIHSARGIGHDDRDRARRIFFLRGCSACGETQNDEKQKALHGIPPVNDSGAADRRAAHRRKLCGYTVLRPAFVVQAP